MKIREEAFKYFFYFMQERMNLFWRRKDHNVLQNSRFTDDPILQEYKFTNVYRVCGRVSQYLIKDVIYNHKQSFSEEDTILRILLFKIFNRIDTWEFIEKKVGIITFNNFDDKKISLIDSTKSNEASNPDYIKKLLRDRIRWSGAVIVLIGPQTHTRDWVNWEINQENKEGKPIIGVFIQGAKDLDVPANFEKYGNALVGWNSGKIIRAIDGKCNDWVFSNGEPWKNRFTSNPFGPHCTLATCKPKIRKYAEVNDWVFGTTSTSNGQTSKLVYAMLINQKMNFNSYYNDSKFQYKKPIMNGSLKQMYGDNIYHSQFINNEEKWLQDNSYHSNEEGEVNPLNLRRDTLISKDVLVSTFFYYFGCKAIDISPSIISDFAKHGPSYRLVEENIAQKVIIDLKDKFDTGFHNDPLLFENQFKRYNGK